MYKENQEDRDAAIEMSRAFIKAENAKMQGKTGEEKEALLNIALNSMFHTFGAIFHSVGFNVKRQLLSGLKNQCTIVSAWFEKAEEESMRKMEAQDGQ